MWRLLGGMLPPSIREGVYEPACLDLWRARVVDERATSLWRRTNFGLVLAGYLLAAAWYGLPRYLNERPRTRAARWVTRGGLVLLALGALAVFGPFMLRYINYGPS